MLIATAFCLNLAFASPSYLAAAPISLPNTVGTVKTTPHESVAPAMADDTSAKKNGVDEDFHVFGDPLHKELKGNLKGAFEAFEKGDFKKAEREFGKLAIREFVSAQRQRWNELDLPNILSLPLNRRTTFATDRWDALSETPESASLAISRSKFDLYSTARLDAAASKLFFLKGLAQERQGKVEKALKSYKKALALHKNNVDARVEYALLLLRQNDLETSGKQLKKLAEIFGRKCEEGRCKYAPESKKRYSQIQLAYTNILEQSKTM